MQNLHILIFWILAISLLVIEFVGDAKLNYHYFFKKDLQKHLTHSDENVDELKELTTKQGYQIFGNFIQLFSMAIMLLILFALKWQGHVFNNPWLNQLTTVLILIYLVNCFWGWVKVPNMFHPERQITIVTMLWDWFFSLCTYAILIFIIISAV